MKTKGVYKVGIWFIEITLLWFCTSRQQDTIINNIQERLIMVVVLVQEKICEELRKYFFPYVIALFMLNFFDFVKIYGDIMDTSTKFLTFQ